MAEAQIEKIVDVDVDAFFKTITDYENYPEFVDGCSRAEVESRDSGKVKAAYYINLIKDISYTLEHQENKEAGTMSWKLLKSDFLKKNTGSWKIKSAGKGKTAIEYTLDIEFKIPVPSFVLSKLIKSSLPAMIKNFESRAKENQ